MGRFVPIRNGHYGSLRGGATLRGARSSPFGTRAALGRWLGAIGWFGFLRYVMLLVVVGAVALVRAITSRSVARRGGPSSA